MLIFVLIFQAQNHSLYECKIFSKRPPGFKITNFHAAHPAYECILALRCLLQKEMKNGQNWQKLLSMEHHMDLRKELDPLLWERNEINTVRRLKDWYKISGFDEETIHRIIGVIDVNAYQVNSNGKL